MIFERNTLIFAFNAILCLEIIATTDDCYKDSSSYTGNLNVSVTGRMCMAWSETYSCKFCNFPDGSIAAAANYCRDPSRRGILWCFTAIGDMEQCLLESCTDSDDCYKDSSSYTGNLSVSVTGRMCMAWSETIFCAFCNFPDGSIAAAANYCRDPRRRGILWCFTAIGVTEQCQLESCKVTVCSGRSCANGDRQIRSGNECICNCSEEFGGDRCEIVMVRSEWPEGPYALLMLRNRCPEGQEKGWTTGHIDITTHEIQSTSESYNSVIDDLYLNYTFVTVNGSSLRLKFCSKVANIGNDVNNKAVAWPEGDVGIFGINESCPQGFIYKGLRLSLRKNVTVDMEGVVPAVFNQNANELMIQICTKAAEGLEDNTPHLKSNIPFSLLNNGQCLIDAAFTVREVGVLLPGISSGTSSEIKFCIFEPHGLVKLAEVRLSNGNISSEGFVQIQYGGHWWSICDGQPHKWGDNEANVACKVAGYSYGIADIEKYPINASEQAFTVSLRCNGRENELSNCNIYWHDWSTKRNCSLRAVARCFRGCLGITCKNSGILKEEESKCSCICPHGYFGLLCEIKQGVSNWPPGPFALPMVNNTCPENWGRGWWWSYVHVVWKERWLLAQQIKPKTVFGQFTDISFKLTFCVKSGNSAFTNGSADVKWPEGSYGIYRLNKSCPAGFISSEETIVLPAVVTVNTAGLVPVEFLNHSNTLIIYTCWKDRNQNISVGDLPWKPPFIILKDPDKSCMNQESSTVSSEIVALPSRNGYDIISHKMEFCSYATSASANEETAAQVDRCDQNLVSTDGNTSALQFTSSSEDRIYSLSRIGLYNKGWCALSGDPNPFVQVDLLFAKVVEGLRVSNSFVFTSGEETLGPILYNAGAKDLVISYGNDVEKLLTYIEENELVAKEKKIFSLDYNDYEKTISFVKPFIARYVKIDLVGVWNRPCLRLEITGCRIHDISVNYKCNPGSIRRGWVSRVEGFLPASKLDIPGINSSEACAEEADSKNAVAFQYSMTTDRCIIAVDNMTTLSRIDKEDYMVKLCYDVVNSSQDYVHEMDGPGIIASDGYPFYYIQNTRMLWMVQMENSVYPDVYFIDISLEDSSEVMIHLNPEKIYLVEHRYTLTSQMNGFQVRQLSTSNQLFISFSTESNSNVEVRKGRGFIAMVTQSRQRGCLNSCDKFDNDKPVLIISKYLLVSPGVSPALPEVITFDNAGCDCMIYLYLVYLNAVCDVSQLIVERSSYAVELKESWCNLNRPRTNESRRILPDANLKITFLHYPIRDDENHQQGFELKYVSRQHADLCVTLNSDYAMIKKFCFIVEFNRTKITWSEANETCRRKHDGRLASLHTEEEFRTAQQLVYHSTIYFHMFDSFFRVAYIGFHRNPNGQRKGDPREFTWLDGKPLTYSAWGGGFPSMYPGSDCAVLNGDNFDANAHIENALCTARVTEMFICEINSSNTDAVREKLDQPVLPSHGRNMNISHVWKCKSGEFIVLIYYCDRIPNCLDSSDEDDCIYTARDNGKCPADAFQCSDGNCISTSQFCDHIQNCKDGSDEDCEYRICKADEIRCNNGQCILKEDWCDAEQNCFDGSDEKLCPSCSGEGKTSYRCTDLTCISMERVCDGFYDCPNMDDEEKCTIDAKNCHDWWNNGKRVTGVYAVSFENTSPVNVECNFDHVNEGLLLTTVYNVDYTMYFESIYLIYPTKNMYHFRYSVNKGRNCTQSIRFGCTEPRQKIADITGESLYPECRCEWTVYTNMSSDGELSFSSEETSWICPKYEILYSYTSSMMLAIYGYPLSTILPDRVTVGPLVCQETFYPDYGMMPCDKGHPVSNKTRCLYDEDRYGSPVGCADRSHTKHCDTFSCPENFVKCPGSYCLAARFVCDGLKQCPNGEDEVACGSRGRDCPGYCRCNTTNICLPPSQVCDGIVHCPSGDDERFCNMNCPGTCICQGTFVDCRDGRITATEIALLSPESRKLFFSKSTIGNISIPFILPVALLINLSDSGIQEIQPGKFESMKNLRTLDISCNKLIVLYANTFKGLKRLRELILYNNRYLKRIERGAFRELENIEEINITHLLISDLQSATFEGLQNVKRIDLRFNKIHQVENRAFYGLEKLETLLISNNEIKVFESEIFNGMTSLHYLETDNLELCCLKPNSVDEAKCLSQKDEFASCENLVRNVSLRVLLWIIGSLSLVGNLVSFIYRKWKEGIKLNKGYGMFVTNLIVADFLMGIYLLIIAVADAHFRNSYARRDEWCRSGEYCAVAAVLSTLSSEASIFFVMLITLDRILVVKFPFGQVRLTPRVCIAVSYLAWLIAIVLSLLPLGLNMYFQGKFYSRTTACFAFPLTKDKPPGWEYAFGILITLNVLLSFLIAFGQLLIFKETRARSAMLKRQKSSRDQALVVARNLFLVVFANCLCWLPIGVVGILALMKYTIPGDVYAWVFLVILPISSVMNPIIYTLSAAIKGETFMPALCEQDFVSKIDIARVDELFGFDVFFTTDARNLTCASTCIENRTLNLKQIQYLTTKIGERLDYLHKRMLYYGNLTTDNIWIFLADEEIKGIWLQGKPKRAVSKQMQSTDIRFMESVLGALMEPHVLVGHEIEGPE